MLNPNDGVNQLNPNDGKEYPKSIYSHTITAPGMPLESLISSIALLLNVYAINHQAPYNPQHQTDSMTTGNKEQDARFMAEYLNLKMMLDDLSKQHTRVDCVMQSNGVSIYMRFNCY